MANQNAGALLTEGLPKEAELMKLRAELEEHMKDLSPQNRYDRVAVLLLYWDKTSESHMDTSEEVIHSR